MIRRRPFGWFGPSLISLAAILFPRAAAAQPPPPLPHQVYVWQRAWTGPVREAVAQHATNFACLVALAAEVSWRSQQPALARVSLDYAALAEAKIPVGLALRIGPWPGPFSTNDPAATFLTSLAAALVEEAKAKDLIPSELQIDFDCAASKLDGYRVWVEAIRRKVAGTPVAITALPSWLNESSFPALAHAADGYVLQVHSLERPADMDAPFTLCDPGAARRAVERAGKIGAPFRVALPTYGYLLAFDAAGHFAGLSAEGPGRDWPEGAQLREARTDPVAMAQLVQEWNSNRPAALRGIIWYRLPVQGDTLNLRWPTLAAIMAARFPRTDARAESRRVEPGLVEISLVNHGELDLSSRLAVEVRWQTARLVAGGGSSGFDLADEGPSTVQFQTMSKTYRLPAGEKQVIGWLRLSQEREVQLEIKENYDGGRAGPPAGAGLRAAPGLRPIFP